MDSYKLAVKFFFENPASLHAQDLIPVFHRWIQARALEGHQLIDVADYEHVYQGPGTLLVSHEANIHADLGDGKLGLLYIRKQPLARANSFSQRLRAVFTSALKAALLLEQDQALAGRFKIRTDEAVLQINDRLTAPNSPETFAQIKGDLESFLKQLYGVPTVELNYRPDAERLFEVGIRTGKSAPVRALLDRLATA